MARCVDTIKRIDTSVSINKNKLVRDPNSYDVDTNIKYRSLNNHNY